MMKKTRETKLSAYHRVKILSLIKEHGPLTLSELSKKLNVSRPTVYLHVDTLEHKGLIIRKKDLKKKGAPVSIHLTSKANPIELSILESTWGNWRKMTGGV